MIACGLGIRRLPSLRSRLWSGRAWDVRTRQDDTRLLLPHEEACQIVRRGPQQDVQLDVPARVKRGEVVAQPSATGLQNALVNRHVDAFEASGGPPSDKDFDGLDGKSSEPRRQAVRCRGGADCRRPSFGKSTRSTPPSPISSARSAIRWVSRKSFTCALGPPPALQWWISVSTSRKSRSQILERLDRFADDLLDGRLGFDPWPSRIPAEARIRSG